VTATLERTDHVGYTVSNLDRSVEFWSFLLEREPTARKTWDVPYLAIIQGYDADMETYTSATRISRSSPPTCIERSSGFAVAPICAAQRRCGSSGGRTRAATRPRVRDPDGITIELVQLPEGGVKL
jgi:catechol 2,3-dioxygenase-like lactoylglutathione lyase family enzyme